MLFIVLLWYSSDAPLMFLWCSSGATLMLLWCSSRAPLVLLMLHWCSSDVPLVLLMVPHWCASDAPHAPLVLSGASLVLWWYSGVAHDSLMLLSWCSSGALPALPGSSDTELWCLLLLWFEICGGSHNMFYESFRRKPGWRFTAGVEFHIFLFFSEIDNKSSNMTSKSF